MPIPTNNYVYIKVCIQSVTCHWKLATGSYLDTQDWLSGRNLDTQTCYQSFVLDSLFLCQLLFLKMIVLWLAHNYLLYPCIIMARHRLYILLSYCSTDIATRAMGLWVYLLTEPSHLIKFTYCKIVHPFLHCNQALLRKFVRNKETKNKKVAFEIMATKTMF